MLKRFRRLHISLAAKCQLLFGAAVVLIIGAALYVPWQRMEQLTEELNEKSAAAVAQVAVANHLVEPRRPSTRPAKAAEGLPVALPRLVAADPTRRAADATAFEQNALSRFAADPRKRLYSRTYAGGERYRYAEPLYAQAQCLRCHTDIDPGPATRPTGLSSALTPQALQLDAAIGPATHPLVSTTLPAMQKAGPLMGLVSVDIPSQISQRQLLLNRVFLITAGLLAGSVAIVIFYLITTRLILQPVRVLQETAERVAEGNLDIRSDINTGDEFQQLSETFNAMLANLKKSADQLRAVNKSLDLRLGQLAESNVALFEANKLKSEFLASVSHELRTPLNSILGFAELLKEQASQLNDGKLLRYVQNIHGAGANLLDLINDLLDLAKIEAGRMDVRSEPLSLPDVFEGLASLLKPLTEPKALAIDARVETDVPILRSDPAKLQQILYNLLSNAIKFSPPESIIDVRAFRKDPQRIRIEVTDSGPGIDARHHAVIFEKFRQLDASTTRQHGGTGLGLAISRELAQLLGGTIGVISALGAGATFWIEIPLIIEAGAQEMRGRMVLSEKSGE